MFRTPTTPAPSNDYTREEKKALSDAGAMHLGHVLYGKDWEGVGEEYVSLSEVRCWIAPMDKLFECKLLEVKPLEQVEERRYSMSLEYGSIK